MSETPRSRPALIRPPAPRAGDAVAIVSPSWGGAGLYPRQLARATAALEQHLGVRVQVMPHALRHDSWVSASAGERADDLHRAFRDPSVRLILGAIGGDHSAQVLPELDFDLIAAHPKALVGYSDLANLVQAVHARTGLVTFYGVSALMQFGELPEPHAFTLEGFRRVVMRTEAAGAVGWPDFLTDEFGDWESETGKVRAPRPAGPPRALRAGSASGPLLAGCLPSVGQLLGTPWQPDYAGRVLLLETPEQPYTAAEADRDLWHLRNAGLLHQVAALGMGRPAGMDQPARAALDDVILGATAGARCPVVVDLPFGHTDPVATLPLGVRATLSADGLSIDEPAVSP